MPMATMTCASCGCSDSWNYDRKQAKAGRITVECRACRATQETTLAAVEAYESALMNATFNSAMADIVREGHSDTGRTGGDALMDAVIRRNINECKAKITRWQELSENEKEEIASEMARWQLGDVSVSPKHAGEIAELMREWRGRKADDYAPRLAALFKEAGNIPAMDDTARRALHARVKRMQHGSLSFLGADDKARMGELRQTLVKAIAWKWWEVFGR